MVDREIVATRLSKLREALRNLHRIAAKSRAEYLASEMDRALAEHYLRLSLEAVLDTGNHVIAAAGHRKPLQLRDIPLILAENGILPEDLAKKLSGAVGLRNRLVHVYAGSGRAADALAVCERYPNDILGAMIYGRILALYQLGRHAEAAMALAQAKERLPHIAKMLTAKKPCMPKLQTGLMSLGGEDEAWHYRQAWRGVWERCGALDWLRRVTGGKT